jgi:hypothetical protein
MTRNQQRILALLGVGVVLVWGSLGAYGLIRLTDPVRVISAGAVQEAEITPFSTSPATVPAGSSEPMLIPPVSGSPAPANTRVIPLVSPAVMPPTATPPSSAPDALPGAGTPSPTHTDEPGPTPPPQATSTTQPPAATPTPPAPPPSPIPDTNCADTENAHHQQMLADIETQYEPMLSWLADELEQAQRDQDEMRVEDLQLELEMTENMKAADIDDEIARHQAALAACGS